MARVPISSPPILTAIGVVAIVAALYFGRPFFMPLALAVLVSLVLHPVVAWLHRHRVPQVAAVVLVVTLTFGLVGGAGYFLLGQVASLTRKLPEYEENVGAKLKVFDGPLANAFRQVQETIEGVSRKAAPPPERPAAPAPDKPVKVEVVEPGPDVLPIMGVILGSAAEILGIAAVVVLYVIFFLIYHADIRDRIIRLGGQRRIHVTTHTMSDAVHGVSRYLSLQSLVNVTYGVALGLGLFALGVPNPVLWGALAAVLRYVPYVGPVIGGALPVLLSLAVFPGWTRPILVAGFIVVLELVSNNVVEPVVYGKRTGLSPLAVIVAAVFWAWLWGGVGLILAIPLTVCLLAVGRYVPGLGFLSVVLGSEPPLDLRMTLYQRLLAGESDEAAELLESEIKEGRTTVEILDALVLPALCSAEEDRRQGRLESEQATAVFRGAKELAQDLADHHPADRPLRPGVPILCLPACDEKDEIASEILVGCLSRAGLAAESLSLEKMAGEIVEIIRSRGVQILCISAVPPTNVIRARYLYKRVRSAFPDMAVLFGLWTAEGDLAAVAHRLAPDGKAQVVTTVAEAAKVLEEKMEFVTLRKTPGEAA